MLIQLERMIFQVIFLAQNIILEALLVSSSLQICLPFLEKVLSIILFHHQSSSINISWG